ncbi:MAG: hypothetical protein MZW92_08985 [Comamonadaceae bacterium]|nr:hypothetical protein [Comamonadaceae bacterium]
MVCPNPFYQIYEGAALLAGAQTAFVAQRPGAQLRRRLGRRSTPPTWARTQLLYVCSPGNPTGAVMPLAEWAAAVRAERPPRLRHRQRRVLLARSISATSRRWARCRPRGRSAATTSATWWPSPACPSAATCPGCARASWPATPRCIKAFLLYRTYHGSAMSPAGAARQHRRLERRGPCGGQPRRCTATSSPQVTPLLARRARRGAARRRASTSGPACRAGGGDDDRLRPRPARSIQCHRPARQPARARSAHGRQPGRRAASAWRWSRRSPNASKPPGASSPTPTSLLA